MDFSSITFKPLKESDLDLLCAWMNKPHVKEWWTDNLTLDEIKSKYGKRIGDTVVVPFIVYLDNNPIGFIQYYQAETVEENEWIEQTENTLGIDQFIGEEDFINRGLGTKMIRTFIKELFEDPKVTRIITDVDPHNLRAIRCYEKIGFKFVKEVMTPDGLANLMEIKGTHHE